MSRAFEKIKELVARNATHRKGFRIADQSPEFDLKYAAGEMIELAGVRGGAFDVIESEALREFADVMNCLQIYAVKRGWTEHMVDAAQFEKLDSRFLAAQEKEGS